MPVHRSVQALIQVAPKAQGDGQAHKEVTDHEDLLPSQQREGGKSRGGGWGQAWGLSGTSSCLAVSAAAAVAT